MNLETFAKLCNLIEVKNEMSGVWTTRPDGGPAEKFMKNLELLNTEEIRVLREIRDELFRELFRELTP